MNKHTQQYLRSIPAETLMALKHHYQIGISETMQQAVEAGQLTDPIVAQFLPNPEELKIAEQELSDPIGDAVHSPVKGLVHRYPNRVLWTVTPTCAVYCRFCFRKEMIGHKGQAMRAQEREQALTYIAEHQEIEEVIFSGGDPLTLTNAALARLFTRLESIEHVRRVRLHTRIPLVKPNRINDTFCRQLRASAKAKFVVIHANHTQEFTPQASRALQELVRSGVMLFSQTVLLKGVNNDLETLTELMNTFLAHGITPYYLHHLDLAKGTQHFRVSIAEGLALEAALRKRLSGIAMPTYIVEIPGGDGKIPVAQLSEAQRLELTKLGIF